MVSLGPEETSAGTPGGSITVVTRRERSELDDSDAPLLPVVEVTYDAVPIANGEVAEDGLRVSLPFAGGALDPDHFAASVYVVAGAPVPTLSTVVTVRQPRLSDLERRALDRMPGEIGDVDLVQLDVGAGVERLIELRTQLLLAGRPP